MVYCTADYSSTCDISSSGDEWICDPDGSQLCNSGYTTTTTTEVVTSSGAAVQVASVSGEGEVISPPNPKSGADSENQADYMNLIKLLVFLMLCNFGYCCGLAMYRQFKMMYANWIDKKTKEEQLARNSRSLRSASLRDTTEAEAKQMNNANAVPSNTNTPVTASTRGMRVSINSKTGGRVSYIGGEWVASSLNTPRQSGLSTRSVCSGMSPNALDRCETIQLGVATVIVIKQDDGDLPDLDMGDDLFPDTEPMEQTDDGMGRVDDDRLEMALADLGHSSTDFVTTDKSFNFI